MTKFYKSVLFLCLFALTACGPMYKTKYRYSPPKDGRGKMCVMQCNNSKKLCTRLCQNQNANCISRARDDARFRYEQYVSRRKAAGKPTERDLDSFYNPSVCSLQSCGCDSDYRACYEMCGGKVESYRECVAFCN